MHVTTISSCEFDQDISGAKLAAAKGPVFIADQGQPSHVLLTIAEYRRLTGTSEKISRALSMPLGGATDFDLPKLNELFRPAELHELSDPSGPPASN